jgi:tetratricopeptide (TPR) repeat protein
LIYYNAKNYDQALSDFNKAIELDLKYVYAYYNRGDVYKALGKYTQAIADYNKASELDPNYAWPWHSKALVYISQKDYEKALESINKALTIAKNATFYSTLGDIYREMGKIGKALASYDKALEINPFDIDTSKNKQAILTDINNIWNELIDPATCNNVSYRINIVNGVGGAYYTDNIYVNLTGRDKISGVSMPVEIRQQLAFLANKRNLNIGYDLSYPFFTYIIDNFFKYGKDKVGAGIYILCNLNAAVRNNKINELNKIMNLYLDTLE